MSKFLLDLQSNKKSISGNIKKMGFFIKIIQTTLIALALLATIFPINESYAQWSGTQGSGMPGMRRGANRNTSNQDSSSNPQNSQIVAPGANLLTYEQIETRLTQLEDGLKITSEQSKAWGNFAIKVRLYASDVAKERARLNAESNTTVDGLKYLSQASEEAKTRYTSLKEVDEAARPLYKLLSVEQKSTFDNKIVAFIATTPKRMGTSQPSYNLPDLGASSPPTQNAGSLPGYIHQ
jgi:hypothetical protein